MGTARILILLIAAVSGAAAFFLVSTGQSPQEAVAQAVPVQREVETVKVLVSSRDVMRGEAFEEKETKWIDWPKNSVPEFYITKENEDFVEALPQMRAVRLIKENEAIYADNTVRQGDRGMLAAIMNPGMRAITAKVAAETSAGGFILPGDRVDVYASGELQGQEELENVNVAVMILNDVRVLAIDQSVVQDEEEGAAVGRTVTLEVRPDQVELFLAHREDATITLVLRSIFEGTATAVPNELPKPDEVIVLRYGQG